MLISKRISISRVISGTWINFILDTLTCVATYLLFRFIPDFEWNIPALIPSILGTALAFFIGFNNNQAYNRWWEARIIWGGLVNDSRTWARQLLYFNDPMAGYEDEEKPLLKTMVFRHIAFLYALKEKLRKQPVGEYLKYISEKDQEAIQGDSNQANAILNLQSRDLNTLYKQGKIDGFQFMELNKMLVNFCDGMGKSERIFSTVFPTTYNYYTRVFIWIFIICATLVTASNIGPWSILAGTLIGYVFLTIHQIGQFLLNPFDDIPTGVPLNQITRTIEINLMETLGEEEIPEPVMSVDGEYVM